MLKKFISGDYTAVLDFDKWKVSDPYYGIANITLDGKCIDFQPAHSYQFTSERLCHINILMSKIREQHSIN